MLIYLGDEIFKNKIYEILIKKLCDFNIKELFKRSMRFLLL